MSIRARVSCYVCVYGGGGAGEFFGSQGGRLFVVVASVDQKKIRVWAGFSFSSNPFGFPYMTTPELLAIR
jgi:hypothetical protein